MAKYAYAPLSVDEKGNRATRKGGKTYDGDDEDDGTEGSNERMPMFIGICVLLAIVYVLSRTGKEAVSIPDPPAAVTTSANSAGVVDYGINEPITTTTTSSTSSSSNNSPNVIDSNSRWSPSDKKTVVVTDDHSNNNGLRVNNCPPPKKCDFCDTCEDCSKRSNSINKNCAGLVDPTTIDAGTLRQKALSSTSPGIIECAAASDGGSQDACHLPRVERYASLKQKGATLWMTGCSGAGKTTIATALEDRLVKLGGKHVYRLDGDNLRTGLNRDLTFTTSDREESVRRTGEVAALFSDAGVITLVGLISPYRADRDEARRRHESQGIPFYEIFLDVPVSELKKRDPKGQYKRVESGELKHFTCIDDPYEEPLNAEMTLKTHEMTIEESSDKLFRMLEKDGILEGAPKVAPPGLPNPDGDIVIDQHAPEDKLASLRAEANNLPKVRLTDVDLNWLQVIGEGWASPLKGFMREGALLETLHFNSMLVDPFNVTGAKAKHETTTNFQEFPTIPPPNRVSMSVPITLPCTEYTRTEIINSGKSAAALVTQMGEIVAIIRDPEIYANRKEEIITRMFGAIDPGHPYVKRIYAGGDYLIGGEVELLGRIRYNDGLDKWRLTASELTQEFKNRGADTVYAFQTRNPTHAGHAYLMKNAGESLKAQGYKNPVLWLSPLGGWTKEDDVPLDVRVKQHEEVLSAGLTHPGGLDPKTTVMAIWPAPMVYAGPTEVQFHAKSRRSAGASYFVVGRDPAGMKGSNLAEAHKDDDLYDGDHGRYVLQNSPGVGDMKFLSFVKVMYDTSDDVMKVPDDSRPDDFISISGTKMRTLAASGATPCAKGNVPTDLLKANCIPPGFMVPKGWDGVVDYYRNRNEPDKWIPWSRPVVDPPKDAETTAYGIMGTHGFKLAHNKYKSLWHDIDLNPPGLGEYVINLVTEIPMYMTAKMELNKKAEGNVIAQDINKDGSPRYYTYGTPFFNYGYIPKTWEDPSVKSDLGYKGDNDPLDVMEIGSERLLMGSITPCKILGSLELIDEGETDHKIICISTSDRDANYINDMNDLDRVKPGTTARLVNWLKRYKTSDGKPENKLSRDTPTSPAEALSIIRETHDRWKILCRKDDSVTSSSSTLYGADGFWLDSPGCYGNSF